MLTEEDYRLLRGWAIELEAMEYKEEPQGGEKDDMQLRVQHDSRMAPVAQK